MRKHLLLAAAIAALGPVAVQAEGQPTVAAAEAEWYEALIAADAQRLDDLLMEGFTYQHPSGNTYGKAPFIELFASGAVTVDSLGEIDRTVRDFGDTVVVYGANPIGGQLGAQRYDSVIRWVNVWRDEGDGWRIIHRNSELIGQ